ncbi:F-box/LRR-repeat protein At4g14103-like [Lotus japonicus]|uniref:F-box/LRR-repeat protein At4g14103-like n=1 Tax=Lotus japonicus TaxID=34305 RepID=UPI002586CEF3|nr:F-box/LRR-repeat protein At4g14103-like [Lotus japonicus]
MVAADRISQLPEELLLLILSFLPTEYVVVTSLVSKRWRPLWLSVPTLDFDELRYLNRRPRYRKQLGFVNFMSTTIQARGSRQPIKEFRLTCYCEDHLTKRWLNEVIQCGVENIDVKCYPSFDLPSSIFNCATLVVLKLRWPFFENNDISSVYLPSLKTLHLKNAGFLKPQNFMALLYGCPILENLEANTVFFLDPSFEGEFKSFSKLV